MFRKFTSFTEKTVGWLTMKMSCQRFATHVASGTESLKGGWSGALHFWLHWFICPFCRRYWKEIRTIGELQRIQAALSNHPAVQLPQIKQRLKEKLMRRNG